uniref:Retrovirus-related Pol polyprotein from transposon TNT 1-94 n=1 Tax=Tanacetum cinerariifolium TaxID=118510 RepID=A0A6L2L3N3_TANCI|nr:hypothetical protein [Tanacetum cinerariifolium]
MLADSKLPTTFWAEAVNTACYVHNRVLVVKPYSKTPYELLRGQSSMETGHRQEYILMPLWNDGSLFDSSSKDSDGDNKDNDGPCKESEFDNQERPNAENHTKDVNTAGPSINTASSNINTTSPTVKTIRQSDDFFGAYNDLRSLDRVEVDISNIFTTYPVPTTPNTRIYKDHSLDNVIGDIQSSVQTKRMTVTTDEQGFISAIYKEKTHEDIYTCLFACFSLQEEPKWITNALKDPAWPRGKKAIGTKWVFRNKKDERGIVIRNKAGLVAQGFTQEEGIDYDEVFTPVARIKAIRLFLAYASFMGFLVYHMDVKSAFLYQRIKEQVYVCQPLGFEDPDFPDKVYKLEKALYGLHQAPRAWYETLAKYLLDNGFLRGKIDQTLKFQISSMGELTFFLGLQVKQKSDGIFIIQDKYVDEILRKLKYVDVKPASTPMDKEKVLLKYSDGYDVDVYLYRSMIRSLMYLTSSIPDIMFACQTLDNGEIELNATVDGQDKTITEASVRRHLKLVDADGISTLPTTKNFQLVLMSPIQDRPERLSNLPNEPPLGEGNTSRSEDGSMQLLELMDICTKLSDKVISLENELKTRHRMKSNDTDVVDFSTASPQKDDDEITLVETLVNIKKSAAKVKDDVQAQIQADEDQAQGMIEEERESLSIKERSRLLTEFIDQRKKMLAAKRAKEKRNKPPNQAQQRTYMSNYIKNMGEYTLKQLKRYSFEEIKMFFDKTMEIIRKFVLIKSEGQIAYSKAGEGSSKKDKSLKILDEEELGQKQQKKQKERFNSSNPTEDKEIALWVELMRLFEPDEDDELWKFESFKLIWRLYNWCGVHEHNEMAEELLRKIFTQEERPRKRSVWKTPQSIEDLIQEFNTPKVAQIVEGSLTHHILGPVTPDEKIQKKNDVKARSMLLMALPNEHLMTFNQYINAKSLFDVITTRFGRNDATRKTQKILLKQMYENYSAQIIESLDSIFNRLQKIVSQLAVLVKRNAGPSSSSGSQSMAFISTPSTNNNDDVSTVFGVGTASPQVCTDLEQIHEDDMEEIDLRWQLALLSMKAKMFFQKTGTKITINKSNTAVYDKAKVECFNCHKMGHFARECRVPMNQGNRTRNQETTTRTVNVEDISSKAMVAIDGVSLDWSTWLMMKLLQTWPLRFFQTQRGLASVEKQLVHYKKNERLLNENITVLKKDILIKDSKIAVLKSKLEKISKEKNDIETKIKKFENASQSLDKLIGSQNTNKSKRGLGYVSYNIVPPPHTRRFSPPRIDLSYTGLPEFAKPGVESYGVKPIEVESEGEDEVESPPEIKRKTVKPSMDKVEVDLPKQNDKSSRKPIKYAEMYRTQRPRATKDETSRILKSFITEIENLVDKKVKLIRCDNGIEFKNRVINEFCEEKGIKREYTVARTPQQNRVAERRNRTLIEAARTMVLVVKPHSKTLYELFRGRTPAFSFMRPFGCHVTILNTLDHLGKFDGKSDEGFFVGYFINSKAFRVYNTRTRKVEENLHINFLVNKLIIAGTNSNNFVGKGVSFDADSDGDNKDNDGPCKESEINNQERQNAKNSTLDVNTAGPSINTASLNINTASLTIYTVRQSDNFFGSYNDMRSLDGVEVDISNISTTYSIPNTPNTRIYKDHSLDNVIGDMQSGVQTKRLTVTTDEQGFISAIYDEKTYEDLHTYFFHVFCHKKNPKEGDNYDEVFTHVARIEAIRLFLAYASFMGFLVYQMDVKSAFMYGRFEEEVYVCQPLGFEDPDYPDEVYKVEKALYGLKQAPRAWYETLAKYLLDNGFHRGKIDQNLFIKRQKDDILLVKVYVDDLIFGYTKKELCTKFEELIHDRQDKYVDEILRKFKYADVKPAITPMDKEKALLKDLDGNVVDVHLYKFMISKEDL